MRMKQTELAHDVCSPPKFNDTWYLTPVQNMTIFYDCPSDVIDHGYPIFCNNATSHPGTIDEALEEFPVLRRCGRHVQVPYSLRPGGVELDREDLVRVVDEGFEVEYTVDQECTRCLGIEGHCWNNITDNDDIVRRKWMTISVSSSPPSSSV